MLGSIGCNLEGERRGDKSVLLLKKAGKLYYGQA